MAQRTEKEETEFKAVPETITLCINNCGVTGNPARNNMCQKCFNATTAATSTSTSSPTGSSVTIPHKFAEKLARSEKSARFSSLRSLPDRKSDLDLKKVGDRMVKEEENVPPAKREVNRCSGCRRKVGLTGFRCRCGEFVGFLIRLFESIATERLWLCNFFCSSFSPCLVMSKNGNEVELLITFKEQRSKRGFPSFP
ncbi:hypothetical protein RND71_001524 [Anisodus tanguticus]|uniref:A20-type domain-containing protein n=1 Tax=Anisodus tanguticus TaxID=243964 RepID=A0AAE1T121_9SOLA|nr:hypothetical protein RND71_001524 [Anisodus tanguticus]